MDRQDVPRVSARPCPVVPDSGTLVDGPQPGEVPIAVFLAVEEDAASDDLRRGAVPLDRLIDIDGQPAVDVRSNSVHLLVCLFPQELVRIRFVQELDRSQRRSVPANDFGSSLDEGTGVAVAPITVRWIVDVRERVAGIEVGEDAGAEHGQDFHVVARREVEEVPVVLGPIDPAWAGRLVVLGVELDPDPASSHPGHFGHHRLEEGTVDVHRIALGIGVEFVPGVPADAPEELTEVRRVPHRLAGTRWADREAREREHARQRDTQ
ncbi:hypothetical protein HRbin27_01223 [bacterium HR27]|nr:hypothetical protein HRbin27_01223 [bacterium HR27]